MRRVLRRRSDAAEWSRRNRRIKMLVKSGSTLEEIGKETGLSRERVRQLIRELGIITAFRKNSTRRRRDLSTHELAKAGRLYETKVPLHAIAEEMDLDLDYLKRVVAAQGFKRKFRCAICGIEFQLEKNHGKIWYCVRCSVERSRERNAQYQREHYRKDPEFRTKKSAINKAWKESAAGRTWLEKHRRNRKSRG